VVVRRLGGRRGSSALGSWRLCSMAVGFGSSWCDWSLGSVIVGSGCGRLLCLVDVDSAAILLSNHRRRFLTIILTVPDLLLGLAFCQI